MIPVVRDLAEKPQQRAMPGQGTSDAPHGALSPPDGRSAAAARRRRAILVAILAFVLYNANLRVIRYDDTMPARLLPFSLLLDHNLYLDPWMAPYLKGAQGPNGIYFARHVRGHWMSAYPIILPLVIAPLYAVPAWWIAELHPRPASGDVVFEAVVALMEKLAASLIAAATVALFYCAIARIASPGASLAIALIFGLASETWAISSAALWRHGFTEFSFSLALWGLLSARGERRGTLWPLWTGLGLACAAANKPADAIVALAFLAYFMREGRRELALVAAPLLALGAGTLAYNLHFFHTVLGGYANPFAGGPNPQQLPHTSPWIGIPGLLVSPGRGLLVYTPWTIFAVWGAARAWKRNAFGWSRYLIAGCLVVFLAQASLGSWWGGWCFGPRYLTDLLPFLAFFLVFVWPDLRASLWLGPAFAAAVAASFWVQTVGAFYYPQGWWDGEPANVDRAPSRLWNWRDNPVLRSWRAGPARPDLYYDLYVLLRIEAARRGGIAAGRELRSPARVLALPEKHWAGGAMTTVGGTRRAFTGPRNRSRPWGST